MKTQVKNLKPGDKLSNCEIVNSPYFIGTYNGQKNRACVRVKYPNGDLYDKVWGWETTVTVKTV